MFGQEFCVRCAGAHVGAEAEMCGMDNVWSRNLRALEYAIVMSIAGCLTLES